MAVSSPSLSANPSSRSARGSKPLAVLGALLDEQVRILRCVGVPPCRTNFAAALHPAAATPGVRPHATISPSISKGACWENLPSTRTNGRVVSGP